MLVVPLISIALFHLVAADIPVWKSSILYQIYPRSFADSDGDGNGDLNGIIAHVPYLKNLGIGIVWLSPIFDSPMKDTGYDVRDYQKINPLFGNLTDFDNLMAAIHDNGMHLYLDYVPNHTSDEHPWFNASRYRLDNKDDYYVWKDPSSWKDDVPQPPNNWRSEFGGSAWTYDEVRKQFYLHSFGDYQPDLNYRNEGVLEDMEANMKFWFDRGVDGFRVDAVPFLVEDDQFRDEPLIPGCESDKAYCLDHIYTQNQEGTYETLKRYDEFVGTYDDSTPKHLFLEAYATASQTMKYFQEHSSPFNFILINELNKDTNATELKSKIDNYFATLPQNAWPNWVMGNHDNSRVGTRMGNDMVDAMNLLLLLLPGTSVTYNGEEIGMVDAYLKPEERVDTTDRDPERTPMQWDQTNNAGFSNSSKTWLPVNPNYFDINVHDQWTQPNSHLNTYIRITKKRNQMIESTDIVTKTHGDWVFGYSRKTNDEKYYVVVNMNNVDEEVILKKMFDDIPESTYVHVTSDYSRYSISEKINPSRKITLQPKTAIGLTSLEPSSPISPLLEYLLSKH